MESNINQNHEAGKARPDCLIIVERLVPSAQMPRKAHPSDACFDLFAAASLELQAGETGLVPLGIAIQMPEGWEVQIRGRSGLARRGIVVHPGTVDHLYRLEVKVIVHNLSGQVFKVEAGDRVAQMKPERVWDVVLQEGAVEATDRGGFGSTGLKQLVNEG